MQSPGELQSFTFKLINNNISDMDGFINTLSTLKSNQIRPDLIGSIITNHAPNWLPELYSSPDLENTENTPQSITHSLKAKKHFIETLIGIFPPDRDFIPCAFLLRLLRVANAVRVGPAYLSELEKRVYWRLDEACLEDLMIPCYGHTCDALFDVGLVLRLVKGFVGVEEGSRSGVGGVVKVARVVDCYLADVAADRNLGMSEFYELARAVPGYARSTDDGLYRAVDTYLKLHPGLSKQERNKLCSLIDTRKLSNEASLHAVQNDRIPVRFVLHLLLSEQTKLSKHIVDWSGSFIGAKSPLGPEGLDHSGRCYSRRETTGLGSQLQQMEIKRLKEDVLRLQSECMNMERQIEKIELEKKRSKLMYFNWMKIGNIKACKSKRVGEIVDHDDDQEIHEEGNCDQYHGIKTPLHMKARLVRGKNRRKSLS